MDCLAANNDFPNDSRFVLIAASSSRLDSHPLPLLWLVVMIYLHCGQISIQRFFKLN
jgi:hypothetical protein